MDVAVSSSSSSLSSAAQPQPQPQLQRYVMPAWMYGMTIHTQDLTKEREYLYAGTTLVQHVRNDFLSAKHSKKYAGRVMFDNKTWCAIRPQRRPENDDSELVGMYVRTYKEYVHEIDIGRKIEWAFVDSEEAARRFCNLAPGEKMLCSFCSRTNPVKYRKRCTPKHDESHLTIHVIRSACRCCHDCLLATHPGPVVIHDSCADFRAAMLKTKNECFVLRNERIWGCDPTEETAHWADLDWTMHQLDPNNHISPNVLLSYTPDPDIDGRPRRAPFEIFAFETEREAAIHANELEEYEELMRERMELVAKKAGDRKRRKTKKGAKNQK